MIYANLHNATQPTELNVTSMEGVTDTVSGFFKTVTNFFADGIGFTGHTMSELFSAGDSLFTLSDAQYKRLQALSDKELESIKWNVPNSTKGGYKALVLAHTDAWRELSDYEQRIIEPLEKWLKSVSRSNVLDLRMPASLKFEFFDRVGHQKLLNAMTAGGIADEVSNALPLLKAVPRLSDVQAINTGMVEIEKSVRNFDIGEVLFLERRIAQHVEAIEVMIQSGLRDGSVKESDLRQLVFILRNAAEEQALIARTRYQLMRVETNLRAIAKAV